MVKQVSGGVSITVRVHPRAKKNGLTGMVGEAYKLALTSPPVDGKANAACIEFFAKLFRVPRSSVTITAGLTSRNKTVRVAGLSVAAAQRAIGDQLEP